ncbi:MAG: molecular chaperone HtpG [Spirochaetales bacterium]|nr:molecular chaperone HtpG [Spirochaetales bacterium]
MERKQFKTEVSQLLHLIIHSLYSNREIFLRELISNASDALDKLKYQLLTSGNEIEGGLKIELGFTEGDKRTLTISDNGIGMSHDDLNEDLGTIARSGTRKFLENLTEEQKKDSNLIGQFGVGFYSVFMVASKVEVVTRKYGEDQAWKWASDGVEKYTIEEAERPEQGTTITIYLNEDGSQFANRWDLERLVKKYSNHVAYPIFLSYDQNTYNDKYEVTGKEHKREQINSASALWTRSKSELTDKDYNEFYKSSTGDSDDPLFYVHTKAEGANEYTTLFFVPAQAPFDMYHADYKPGVKLYVKRVFITDDDKELLPTYLRFVRGIIDSEDLPLNVSREILQQNRVMSNIRTPSVKKLLSEFKKIAESNPELYKKFIDNYNRPLKEGLYSDFANKSELAELVRFKSTSVEGYTSLAQYKERMGSDQKSIYYLTGSTENTLRNSPLLGKYKQKGIEVLLMDDDIDDLVMTSLGQYQDVPLKAVNKSDSADELSSDEEKKEAPDLVARFKQALGDLVKDVKVSNRLTDASAAVVADADEMSIQMQQIMRMMDHTKEAPQIKPILEINIDDPVVKKIQNSEDQSFVTDACRVLLDQALLAEGLMPSDPADFSRRLHNLLA